MKMALVFGGSNGARAIGFVGRKGKVKGENESKGPWLQATDGPKRRWCKGQRKKGRAREREERPRDSVATFICFPLM